MSVLLVTIVGSDAEFNARLAGAIAGVLPECVVDPAADDVPQHAVLVEEDDYAHLRCGQWRLYVRTDDDAGSLDTADLDYTVFVHHYEPANVVEGVSLALAGFCGKKPWEVAAELKAALSL